MYPDGDLNELAERKLALRRKIALRREECVIAATELARPVEKIDRALVQWKRVRPLAKFVAVPLAMLFQRRLFPRSRTLGTLLRWGPLAVKVLRGFGTARSR